MILFIALIVCKNRNTLTKASKNSPSSTSVSMSLFSNKSKKQSHFSLLRFVIVSYYFCILDQQSGCSAAKDFIKGSNNSFSACCLAFLAPSLSSNRPK